MHCIPVSSLILQFDMIGYLTVKISVNVTAGTIVRFRFEHAVTIVLEMPYQQASVVLVMF